MSLVIYDSLSKQKVKFEPLTPGKVNMYVCGPTVYGLLHVGNFFGPIFFNMARNWLEKKAYTVNYVYNYTDVDDKIINTAKEQGVTPQELAEKYIKEFRTDFEALELSDHSANPRVTEHMDDIVALVTQLVTKEKAYVVDGDVYFDVGQFPEYGQLSGRNLDDVDSGSRIEVDPRKKHPADFALWKSVKPGEPSWPSPWGSGRPGWHIECSSMIKALLGESIDIHGGGLDLLFPHHENERAQSQACSGKTFVKYWMHTNMVNFGDQKMSKSLGNIRTARSFMKEYGPEVLKMMILSSHYRSPIDLSEPHVMGTISALGRIYSCLSHAKTIIDKPNVELVPLPEKFQAVLDHADLGIEKAMDDDFNTSVVMANFFEVVRSYNQICRKPGKVSGAQKSVAEVTYHWVRKTAAMMALFQQEPATFLVQLDDLILQKKAIRRSDVDGLVAERNTARADKNYAESDRLRDQLKELGISLQDSAEGTFWEVEKN